MFRERGREGERERNIGWLPFARPQLGTWPNWESNWRTSQFVGQLLTHGATPARVSLLS